VIRVIARTDDEREERLAEGTLASHLIELRRCLVRALLALLIVFLALAPFTDQIFRLVALPMTAVLPENSQIQVIGITASFLIPLKTVLYVALMIAMPYALYQAWRFIAPGLYRHERRVGFPLLLSTIVLFYAGVAFAYFFVFRLVFSFFFSVTPDFVVNNPDIEAFLSFWLAIILAFGIAFEVPVATFLLVWSRLVALETLAKVRRYAFLGAFVAGMFLTPADIWSQTLLAIPMYLLYEGGLLLARFLLRDRAMGRAGD
jgi:sec-independent protein translocase protein TatC